MVCTLEHEHIHAKSSGLKTKDALIHTGACWYLGATLITDVDGSGQSSDEQLIIFDSLAAGTNHTDRLKCSGEEYNSCHILEEPIWMATGIHAELNTDKGDYIVWYSL